MKLCPKCKVVKPLSDFHKRSDRPCGVQPKCKACSAAYQKANLQKQASNVANWRKRNPNHYKEYMRNRRSDSEALADERARERERYWQDPEKFRAKSKAWQVANPLRQKQKRAEWWANNPGARNAARMKRHAAKLRATPVWANQRYIALWYEHAKLETARTGQNCEVDHIVPLQHQLVCGLHTEHNLQILFTADNRSKNNRFWTGMPMS